METYIQYRFVEVVNGVIAKVDEVEIQGRSLKWDDYIRIAGCQNWMYCGTLPATTLDAPDGFTMLFAQTRTRNIESAEEEKK